MTGPSDLLRDEDVRRYLLARADRVVTRARSADAVAVEIAERVGLMPRRRTGRAVGVRIALVVALLGALLAGLYLIGQQRERYAPDAPEVTTTLRGSPWAIAAAEGSVWVGAYRSPVLFRLDPADGSVTGEVELRNFVCGQLQAGLGYLWFSECGTMTIARLDPDTLKIDRLAGYGTDRVTFADVDAWLPTDGAVERIDPKTLATLERIPVTGTGLLAWGFGSVWMADADGGVVRRIEPGSGQVATVNWPGPPPYPVHLDVTDSAVWVVDERGLKVYRIDPTTNVASAAPVDLEVIDGTGFGDHIIVAAAGQLWVRELEDSIIRLDPGTGRLIDRQLTEGAGGGAFAVTPDAIWFANMKAQTVTGVSRP